MAIIKLTHTHKTYREKKQKWYEFGYPDIEFQQHWDTLPTYHDTAKCVFFSASAVVEGKEVVGSVLFDITDEELKKIRTFNSRYLPAAQAADLAFKKETKNAQ